MTTTLLKSRIMIGKNCQHCLLVALQTHLGHLRVTKRNTKRYQAHSHPSSLSVKKFDSRKGSSDDYKLERRNKESRGLEVLKPVNAYLNAAMKSQTYRLTAQSRKYSGRFFGKIAKWSKRMDVQLNSSIYKPSDPMSVPDFLHNFKTAYDSNGIH